MPTGALKEKSPDAMSGLFFLDARESRRVKDVRLLRNEMQ
jgi:hypothetical protein